MQHLKNKKGSASVMLTFFILIILALYTIYSETTTENINVLSYKPDKTISYYISESGITKSIDYIKTHLKSNSKGENNSNNNGNGNSNNNGNGNGKANGQNKEKFVKFGDNRIDTQNSPIMYIEQSVNTKGLPNYIKTEDVMFLNKGITEYMQLISKGVNDRISNYLSLATNYNNTNIDSIISKVNNTDSKNIILKVGYLDVNKDLVLGSINKPVTLIVDGLNTNKYPQTNIEIYGNLIVLGSINGNSNSQIKVHTSGEDSGNLLVRGNININYENSLINVDNELYADTFMVNNSTTIQTDKFIVNNDFNIVGSGTTKIITKTDIFIGETNINTKVDINTKGDFVVRDYLNKNSDINLTVGGRVAFGGKMQLNNNVWNLNIGGYTTSLILGNDSNNQGGNDPDNSDINKLGIGKFKLDGIIEGGHTYNLILEKDENPFSDKYKYDNYLHYKIEQVDNSNYYGITADGYYKNIKTTIECLVYLGKNELKIVYSIEKK